jgi:hypothetical protein
MRVSGFDGLEMRFGLFSPVEHLGRLLREADLSFALMSSTPDTVDNLRNLRVSVFDTGGAGTFHLEPA